MAIGGVVINFVAKTADALGDVKKLTRGLDDVGDSGKKAGGKGGIGGLVSSMGAAVPIVGALAIGAVGAAAALVEMSKAALEDKRQADNLANTLKNIPGITDAMIAKNEEWITSMQLATLVSDTELRAAISKLTLATGDLEEAQTLAALAADVAAGTGKNYATVAEAMAKAASGNTAQLKRMFPWLDKNKNGTVSLKEATDGLGTAFEGAAGKVAKNDPWKRIGIIFDELKESVGTALLPVLDELGDWFGKPKNREAVTKFLNKVAELATAIGDDLVKAIKDLVKWLQKPENQQVLKDWAKSMGDFAKAVGGAVKALGPLLGALEKLKKLTDLLPSNLILRAIGAVPSSSSAAPSATSMGVTPMAAPAPAPTPPTVIVTDEQVYRAISRLLIRGDARNGRRVVVG
jgi:hypothetical protein